MAFCRNCGFEVSNEAYVCTKCGALINGDKPPKKAEKPSSDNLGFSDTPSFKMLFATGILHVLATGVFYANMAYMQGDTNVGGFTWSYPEPAVTLIAFILSAVAMILAIVTYIVSAKDFRSGLISKTANKFLLFLMIASILLAIARLVAVRFYLY